MKGVIVFSLLFGALVATIEANVNTQVLDCGKQDMCANFLDDYPQFTAYFATDNPKDTIYCADAPERNKGQRACQIPQKVVAHMVCSNGGYCQFGMTNGYGFFRCTGGASAKWDSWRVQHPDMYQETGDTTKPGDVMFAHCMSAT